MEVDVEVDAELVQGALDVREHEVDADGAEDLLLLTRRQVQHVRALPLHVGGDVGDVGARISVLRGGLALGGGDQRTGEPVDLGAVVVEVVLTCDRCTLGGQDPAQRVAHGGPAGSTEVDGAGGVRGDELEIDLLAVERVAGPERGTSLEDLRDDRTLRVGGQADVEKARARDVGAVDTLGRGQRVGEPAGQLTRVGTDLLGHLHRDVGGVIAVLGIARTLDRESFGKHGHVESAFGEHFRGGSAEQFGKVSWSHRYLSYGQRVPSGDPACRESRRPQASVAPATLPGCAQGG
ncbi:hypothetical protein MLGJGCBP_02586 [Rhodococcus sp. T7]|nr:hypothetical protein MLGJGCBP_02586 [Rhodococcus sp. T7]